MTQPNLLELAKQGNAKAIAALMNRKLKAKDITAKAVLKEGCLQVVLESQQIPDREASVGFVRQGLTNLKPASIPRVKVYGRKTGENTPAWREEFELIEVPSTSDSDSFSQAQTEQQLPANTYSPKSTRKKADL